MLYFTSDIHFGHKKIIEYCNRPFASVEEMDETIIDNWNKTVKPTDDIYVVGDFSFSNLERTKQIFKRLNGNKYLIMGNHDDEEINSQLGWKFMKPVHELKYNKQSIWLSHYPHRSWNKSFHGSWALFGHAHGTAKPWGLSCDVGVDCWNFCPVSFYQIQELMKTRPKFDTEYENSYMPKGQLWQGTTEFKYSHREFFVGGESKDNLKYIESEFKKHRDIWIAETCYKSCGGHDHPSYHRIIGLGPAVLPFIFDDLRKELQHWFYALACITGESPEIPNPGKMEEIRQIWLNWADLHGYEQEEPA
jgi:calcineurin-like phosphoesterase family protein